MESHRSSVKLWIARAIIGVTLLAIIGGAILMYSSKQNLGVLTQLPDELMYLAEPALKLNLEGEFDIWPYLENITSEERAELEAIGARVLRNNHYPKVNEFLDKYPLDEHDEAANLYFMFGLLDYAEI